MTSEEIVMSIVVADADDWQVMYVNGKMYYQDHDIPAEIVIRLWKDNIGKVPVFTKKEVDFDWLDGIGDFPIELEEVVFI